MFDQILHIWGVMLLKGYDMYNWTGVCFNFYDKYYVFFNSLRSSDAYMRR